MERMQMERMLATPADAEIILRLYDLRRESLMREARAWVTGEFWPATVDEYFAVASNLAATTKLYLLLVQCYQACFISHRPQIATVVNSFTVDGS